jgi:hypothetical protein
VPDDNVSEIYNKSLESETKSKKDEKNFVELQRENSQKQMKHPTFSITNLHELIKEHSVK